MTTKAREPKLPPMATRMSNAIGAAQRVLARAVSGESVGVVMAEFNARLDVCRACDAFRPSDQTCSECGCYIRLKAKLSTESCPLAKWPKDVKEEEPQPAANGNVVLQPLTLLDKELEIREVVPPDHRLIQLYNALHLENQTAGGCKKCRNRRYSYNMVNALLDFLQNSASADDIDRLRAIFHGVTHLPTSNRSAVAWAYFTDLVAKKAAGG